MLRPDTIFPGLTPSFFVRIASFKDCTTGNVRQSLPTMKRNLRTIELTTRKHYVMRK